MRALCSKIISFISYIFAFLVVALVALHFIFGFQYVVVLTDSMEPTIHPGDLIITHPSEVHRGDIILYKVTLGNTTYRIVHRIVDVKTDETGRVYYVTKGDNRRFPDPWRVYPEQVTGKLLLVIPYAGRIYPYLPLIITALLLTLMALLGYELVKALVEEEEDEPSEKRSNRTSLTIKGKTTSKRPGKGEF